MDFLKRLVARSYLMSNPRLFFWSVTMSAIRLREIRKLFIIRLNAKSEVKCV